MSNGSSCLAFSVALQPFELNFLINVSVVFLARIKTSFTLILIVGFRLPGHLFWGFRLQDFRQTRLSQQVNCLVPMEIGLKCFFQGHNDEMPVRESNRESATFRSLTGRFIHELSSPLLYWCCRARADLVWKCVGVAVTKDKRYILSLVRISFGSFA